MKNFLNIANGLDMVPILMQLQFQPELWNQNTLRTQHPDTVHGQVSDIWLRFQDVEPGNEAAVVDEHECVAYAAWYALPEARKLVLAIMARVEAVRLGRVLITKLPPGGIISAHVDGGAQAEYYERYQIMLQNAPGSIFRCGDETITMAPGSVWWFDNSIEHEVVNNSAEDRIALIVDARKSL